MSEKMCEDSVTNKVFPSPHKKYVCISALIFFVLLMHTECANRKQASVSGTDYDYRDALAKAVLYYDAQRCGSDVETDNYFSWRKNCHTHDTSLDHSIDMTGGYHDAGDYLKMGLPQAFVPSTIGFALYEYRSSFDSTKNTAKTLSTLKRFTDYFLKCYQSDTDTFWYHIGLDNDHDSWRLPEADTETRTCPDDGNAYWADKDHAASDICGLTAAALAQMTLNYRSINSTYAEKCLSTAKKIYSLGKKKLGTGRSNELNDFYNSSGYYDDLSWGALWIYLATNDSAFLDESISLIGLSEKSMDGALGWDNVSALVYMKLYQCTKNKKFINQVIINLKYFSTGIGSTPAGLKIYDEGDPLLAYDVSESFVCLHYAKITGDTQFNSLAKRQIDYILGDNPKSKVIRKNWSYIIGFGTGSWPQYVPHPALNGNLDWEGLEIPAKYVLTGALVGGPDKNDCYIDDYKGTTQSEPAMDYNAGLVAALAAIVDTLE